MIRHPFLFALGYVLGFKQPVTETTEPERAMLRLYAKGRRRLAAIGVLCGVNSRSFRKVMAEDGILLAIDPYPRLCFGLRGFGGIRLVAHCEVGRVQRGKVIWVEEKGKDAPDRDIVKAHLPVDFLFVDADHSWQGISENWTAWRPHISLGGIIAFHDSRERNGCGSERFVQECVNKDAEFQLIDSVSSLSVFERVPIRTSCI